MVRTFRAHGYHPDPPLMGRSPEERAVIGSWVSRIEWDGFYAAMDAFWNSAPGFRGRALMGPKSYEQIPALAERGARVFNISSPGLMHGSPITNSFADQILRLPILAEWSQLMSLLGRSSTHRSTWRTYVVGMQQSPRALALRRRPAGPLSALAGLCLLLAL
jgi:hypothetical protein